MEAMVGNGDERDCESDKQHNYGYAVCCSVLQCVAVCCSVLQCVAVCCRVMSFMGMHVCNVHIVAYCNALQRTATHCNTPQHTGAQINERETSHVCVCVCVRVFA